MEKTFQLEIMTPEKQFFKGQAEGLIMPALDGEYGVQPGHEPIVTALEPGTVRYCVKGQWDDVIVGQGFAEVMPDYAILLVSTAERPGEIDKARAERAKAHAEECLRQKQSVQEYHRSKAALARAMARLKRRPNNWIRIREETRCFLMGEEHRVSVYLAGSKGQPWKGNGKNLRK